MQFSHTPVMLDEAVRFLTVPGARRFIDGTAGWGGHAARLLAVNPEASILGLDRDDAAVTATAQRLASFGDRSHVLQSCYADMSRAAAQLGWDDVDGVLLDLGVSSPQLDNPRRGFSYRADGPLDMRMDRRNRRTAAEILNTFSEDELVQIFRDFGDERQPRRIARAVIRRRLEKPWARTAEFADLLQKHSLGGGHRRRTTACARGFQALRIAVNDELRELSLGLAAALDLLRPGGRLVVIAFHSLEDRTVKRFFREQAAACTCPPDLPVCVCNKRPALRILTSKPLRPDTAEINANPRAAPARLRAAEKLEQRA